MKILSENLTKSQKKEVNNRKKQIDMMELVRDAISIEINNKKLELAERIVDL